MQIQSFAKFNFINLSILRSAYTKIKRVEKFTVRYINTFNKFTSMANKEFTLKHYDSIGFDLDNCLVRYNVANCLSMEYRILAEFLVQKGYSENLLKPLDDDIDFLQKGLILDFEKGNLLRICPGLNIIEHSSQENRVFIFVFKF